MTRIFLVDDHALLRNGLRTLLANVPTLTVVAEATNGQELLDQLPHTPADVVLLDLHMPVLDGLATTRRLRQEFPEVRVLILSMEENGSAIGQLLEAGAAGYLLKNVDQAEIFAAIQAVAAGKRYLCSEVGLVMLEKVLAADAAAKPKGQLSQRELEVLQLVAEGLTSQQIADKLFASKRTIETHWQNILAKTETNNTAALVEYAVQRGWLTKK